MPTNRILASLTPNDYALLRPHLEIVDLAYSSHLQVRNQRIQHVYFMEAGLASVFWGADEPIEIAMIGYEGMSGVAAVLGNGVLECPTKRTCRSPGAVSASQCASCAQP